MKNRVTLRDIAAKAGIHFTTVARAMKNDPRVQKATRARVQRLAKEMGYVADPMLAALNAYRHGKRASAYQETVGWITNDPTRDGWKWEAFRLYREGAAEALSRHGYRVEDFWLREPGLTARRASQILFNRGIRGLLVCPLPVSYGHLSLQWERFSAVTFGYTLLRPSLHFFTAAHYNSMQTCMRKLRLLGYRRVGLAVPSHMNHRMHQLWTAAHQAGHSPRRAGKDVPPHQIAQEDDPRRPNKDRFLAWFRAHRPDAVIHFGNATTQWLLDEGYRIPDDVGVASPILQESQGDQAGVIEASRETGRAAGDFLVGMLHRGEFGPPQVPQRILLEGRWNEGTTVRRQPEAKPPKAKAKPQARKRARSPSATSAG